MLGFFTVKAKSSFLYTRYKMEEPSNKYILLRDSVGRLALEKNWLTLGLTMKSTPTQVLRGEILKGVAEAEQPMDSTKVAVVGIERKSLCLECPTEDVARLSEEETNLLLAITSSEGRFQTYIDRKLMVFGRQLSLGSTVFVKVKAHSNVLPGIVWYKGVLPPRLGTWFGVELTKHPGSGTCDGTFGKKQYFTCQPDSGIFVGLDKLTPREDEGDLKSLKIAKKVGGNGIMSGDNHYGLEVGSKVEVPMAHGVPKYGVIRWIGNIPQVKEKLVAGLELEEEESACSDGTFNKERHFTCPAGKGFFVLLENCRPDSRFANSPATDVSLNAEKDNQTELQKMRARLSNLQEQLREKDDQFQEKEGINVHLQTLLNTKNQQLEEKIRQEENIYQKLRAVEEQISQSQTQLREKELEKANLLKERDRQNGNLRAMHQQLTNVRDQLQEEELLKTNMQEQLERKEQQLVESELRLREMNQQLSDLQVLIREKDRTTAALHEQLGITVQQVSELEEQLTRKDQEKNELERSLSTAQQILRDNQAQRSPDWVIPRNKIQLTTKSLGRGTWGEVVQGRFCGCVVAVKTIHDLILSHHNRRLFEREMDIASRCRHPCLLQFIGATNDDHTPLFLTEVMETSLRALLQERFLSQTEITVIALDVARGLNYLHQKHPIPILHRDINSANVLLWRQGTQWRAKVSDYGTANFKKQTMTVAPGALIYSAPEARATNQTVQVDVYSFGVLLCEMSIRELPDPERREQQVAMVANNVFRALIRGCLETDPQARPTMEEIINEIEPEEQGTF